MEKRKTYTKPCLEQVQLALEEAVLAGCKAESLTTGPARVGPRPYGDCQSTGGAECLWIQT